GQEPDEVELGGARSPGGIEIGIVPVALAWRELGIGFTGVLASAMMLVVGKEASQVAQARVGPGGACASAVAVRAHDRTGVQEGGAQPVNLGRIHALKTPGSVGVKAQPLKR